MGGFLRAKLKRKDFKDFFFLKLYAIDKDTKIVTVKPSPDKGAKAP